VTSHVQTASNGGGTISSTAVAVTTTAGNFLTLSVLSANGAAALPLLSVTDSSGGTNVWHYATTAANQNPPAADVFDSANGCWVMTTVAWCRTTASVTSVTATLTGSADVFLWAVADEWSGVPATLLPVGLTDTTDYSARTSWTSLPVTGAAGAPVVIYAGAFSSFSAANTAGYSLQSGGSVFGGFAVASATGPQSCNFTQPSGTIASAVTFTMVNPADGPPPFALDAPGLLSPASFANAGQSRRPNVPLTDPTPPAASGATAAAGAAAATGTAAQPSASVTANAGAAAGTGAALPPVTFPSLQSILALAATQRVDIPVVGDSMTEGWGSSTFTGRYISQTSVKVRALYPGGAAGTGGGLGFIPVQSTGTSSLTWPWTLASGSVNNADIGPVRLAAQMTGAATLTWTAPSGTTSVKILWYNAGSGVSGSWSYKVGAGSATTVSNSGTAADGQLTTPVTITSGQVLTVAWVSGTVYVDGLIHYAGDEASGLTFHGMGISGWDCSTLSAGWRQAGEDWRVSMAALENNGFFGIFLGLNDANSDALDGGFTAAQYQANLAAMITYIRGNAALASLPVLLIIPYQEFASAGVVAFKDGGGWAAYVTAALAVASATPGCTVVNLTSAPGMPQPTSAGGDANFFDGIHTNNTGSGDVAAVIAGILAPPSASASAGTAAGQGTAAAPSAQVTPAVGVPAGQGAARVPSAAATTTAGAASGTGQAPSPPAAITANAGQATGTGTAAQPSAAVTANAGTAAGTGTAPQPSVTTSGSGTANAGTAAGTGTAPQPAASVTATAGAATGSGTARAPSAQLVSTAFAGAAAGSGTARMPALQLAANAQAAVSLGQALQATGQAIIPAVFATATPGGGTLTTAIPGGQP
jgi:lysophospholipase L1-like esterase